MFGDEFFAVIAVGCDARHALSGDGTDLGHTGGFTSCWQLRQLNFVPTDFGGNGVHVVTGGGHGARHYAGGAQTKQAFFGHPVYHYIGERYPVNINAVYSQEP